ncbi:MAG TPA: hypothetical protein VIF62_05625 [Labilithrix sp.]|jgi:hypothetical protein
MIRSRRDVDWNRHLPPEDMTLVTQRIKPTAWYPMAAFERMGNAILKEVAQLDLDMVRAFGKFSVASLNEDEEHLVAKGDPVETLMRFRVLRATYFDFDALDVKTLVDGHAEILIRYHMGRMAEEAASHQTLGFFEGLLESAGAREVKGQFLASSWSGDPDTIVELRWKSP